ncbi:hypothetical protein KO506_14830 [Polaribacter vadi]|uniref:hypothetical protein n=1 Tax=Polaribacter TaxID=52959 RepID=UPI001C09FD01|nr:MULTISPECIES: hypothetical protein [Polaribacter]MBU3012686.1 hypothetical protein [Polaribacter vadi]MDO6742503.1 hypothetical protein [Polaribacter sp. 1_MG-2023]
MNLKRLHYFSGITISLFVGLHLFNHIYSLYGVNAHIELMNDLRVVYRNIIVETILLVAVGIQIISGIRLFFKKRKKESNFFERLQIWTGLYLAVFLIIHLYAVLSGRLILELDTNIYFAVAGLNTFPLNLFFIPYYGLAIISFFGHISAVHSIKMKSKIFGIDTIKQSYGILIIGIILTLVILFGLTNGFNGIEIPKEYNIMIGK